MFLACPLATTACYDAPKYLHFYDMKIVTCHSFRLVKYGCVTHSAANAVSNAAAADAAVAKLRYS